MPSSADTAADVAGMVWSGVVVHSTSSPMSAAANPAEASAARPDSAARAPVVPRPPGGERGGCSSGDGTTSGGGHSVSSYRIAWGGSRQTTSTGAQPCDRLTWLNPLPG